MKLRYLASVVAIALTNQAIADEDKTWEASSELGAIITSGNTETTTFKFGANAKHDIGKWTNEYKLNALYKEDEVTLESGLKDTQRTNEKYGAAIQGNYNLGEKHSHLFVGLTHDSDYFGAYRHETVLSGGYGFRLIDESNMTLGFDFGPGYKYFQYSEKNQEFFKDGRPKAGERDDEWIALAKADFSWTISDNAKFTQRVKVESGSTNTKSISETALLTKINGSLQMKVGFNVTHNSEVDADKVNTDTETVLTLVYSF
ncbi:MAG: DUF481 domain-containing protein [Pseudomonadota bacterium]|uniref:DUF481 domain-containing protein n=1 Tax=Pseudoalteromonas TaxID=53246 RepID=UPI00026CDAAB|nr:DUF481 domain-containing protein [Pseudoalteromonas spongiae]ATC97610.1 hypothetical protein PSPO_a0387 [Pseudoalteromonas spongiae UST010723-006]MEC8325641.1 DUF481 domain-containing protein [Pseudomonadota bacterium]